MTTKNNPPEYSARLMEEVKGIVNQRIVHYGNLSTFKTSMRYTRGQKTKREYKTILRALEAAEARIHELADLLSKQLIKAKNKEILDMAKYDIKDVHQSIDRLMDERFELAACAKRLLGEINDDNGRKVQVQLCLETRPEMFLPMDIDDAHKEPTE